MTCRISFGPKVPRPKAVRLPKAPAPEAAGALPRSTAPSLCPTEKSSPGTSIRTRRKPNITGAELRQWIAATVPRRGSVRVIVAETTAGNLAILPQTARPGERALAPEMEALAQAPTERRRRAYEGWERSPIVGPHEHTQYFRNSLHGLRAPDNGIDVRYLVALLNSKLIRSAYVETIRETSQRTFPQVKLGALASLPLREVATDDKAGRAIHDRLVDLVEALLQLHRKLRGESNPTRRDALANHAAALDGEIDQGVYRLYDLTPTEIASVERAVQDLVAPP